MTVLKSKLLRMKEAQLLQSFWVKVEKAGNVCEADIVTSLPV